MWKLPYGRGFPPMKLKMWLCGALFYMRVLITQPIPVHLFRGAVFMRVGATAGLLLSTIIWGVSFPVVKAALGVMDPFLFVFLRFGIASILVLCYAILMRKNVFRLFSSRILWILGITNALGFGMEFYGMTLRQLQKPHFWSM
ncbi:MAG: EamA family transporter [Candidatus Methanomethylicaceae archaeon]